MERNGPPIGDGSIDSTLPTEQQAEADKDGQALEKEPQETKASFDDKNNETVPKRLMKNGMLGMTPR